MRLVGFSSTFDPKPTLGGWLPSGGVLAVFVLH